MAGSLSQELNANFEVGLIISSVAGGVTEAISGGNFQDGAVTGACVYLFNHLEGQIRNYFAKGINGTEFKSLAKAQEFAKDMTLNMLEEELELKSIVIVKTKKGRIFVLDWEQNGANRFYWGEEKPTPRRISQAGVYSDVISLRINNKFRILTRAWYTYISSSPENDGN